MGAVLSPAMHLATCLLVQGRNQHHSTTHLTASPMQQKQGVRNAPTMLLVRLYGQQTRTLLSSTHPGKATGNSDASTMVLNQCQQMQLHTRGLQGHVHDYTVTVMLHCTLHCTVLACELF